MNTVCSVDVRSALVAERGSDAVSEWKGWRVDEWTPIRTQWTLAGGHTKGELEGNDTQ